MRISCFFYAALLMAGSASAQPFQVQPTGKSYGTLADAVIAIGDGEAVISIAPGTYRDCAVQTAGKITYRAEKPSTAVFDGGTCEGKATLVLRGRGAVVEGIVFQDLRVPDGNGAGIRIERGPLKVAESTFRNSESGILDGGGDQTSDIVIMNSTFSGLGGCHGGRSCAHAVYISSVRSLTVTGCLFHKGTGGHYLKSRAAQIFVDRTKFDDSDGRGTNYLIDLPDGSQGRISGNLLVQGSNKENHMALIAVAAESRRNPSRDLVVANNRARLAVPVSWTTYFIADSSGSVKRGVNDIGPGIQLSSPIAR
ncbi:right-handed parallel beta-helix repeat-containing protein [Sphingomonas sp. SRS2]|uniref:right-handed parallel beta-helix repeat-containing protein n=1 Tax=Sphingomonas sp. SRS2 TaxID=133190 RepID=UPI000618421F|nr:right-handed parallel beta-helix repeat-containing protein [Sphingomonas sp. SRS2]KKC26111.1 hypothetical protein WP12_10585 [Sphingomonas sp. SRS2]